MTGAECFRVDPCTEAYELERTLVILKPDAVQRRLIGAILQRFERKGLKIVAMKLIRISRELAERLRGRVGLFKVGLELFTRYGPGLVRDISDRGGGVFLDVKYHDIPATVAGAVRSAAGLDVRMLTLHGAGGPEMLRAAAEARGDSAAAAENWADVVALLGAATIYTGASLIASGLVPITIATRSGFIAATPPAQPHTGNR